MGKVNVKLNSGGVRKLLKSDEIMRECKNLAFRAQSRLGDGYAVTWHTGKNRVNASIGTATEAAAKENAETNSILKALG